MENIPDVEEAVGSTLLSLGDGNWRMGDGMPVAKSNLGSGDEAIIIAHFMCKLPSFLCLLLSFLTQMRPRRRGEHGNHQPHNPFQNAKASCLWLHLPSQQHLLPTHTHRPRTAKPESAKNSLQTNPRRPQFQLPHGQSRIFQHKFHAAPPNAS